MPPPEPTPTELMRRLERAVWNFYEQRGTKHPLAATIYQAMVSAGRCLTSRAQAEWTQGYFDALIRVAESQVVKDDGVRMAFLGALVNANLLVQDSYVSEERVREAEERFTSILMRGSVDR